MSQQIICDECGQPVDEAKPHYQLTGSKVQMVDGVLTTVDSPVTLHYHEEHLPVYKIGGVDVTPPGEPPAEPPPGDDEPGEEVLPPVEPNTPGEGDPSP